MLEQVRRLISSCLTFKLIILIVAAVRDPASKASEGLKALGVQVVAADYENRDSLIAAYKGIHTVVFVPTPVSVIDRVKHADASVSAAREAGVKRFALHTFYLLVN